MRYKSIALISVRLLSLDAAVGAFRLSIYLVRPLYVYSMSSSPGQREYQAIE